MPALPGWEDLVAGRNCPFCGPRADDNGFNIKIADLGASTLYLDRDQMHAGYSVLIFNKRHVTGIEQLDAGEYDTFMQDLRKSARAVQSAMQPDHMNYATLGNVIPHLHYHIIPRYKNVERWQRPVWTTKIEEMGKKILPDAEYPPIIRRIRDQLV